MFRKTLIVSLISTAMILPAAGQEKNRTRVPGQRPQQGERLNRPQGLTLERLEQALSLTPDQVGILRPMFESHLQALRPLAQDVRDKGQALRSLQEQTSPDPTAVGNAVLALRAAQDRVSQEQQTFQNSLKSALTQEQQETLDGLRAGARTRGTPGRPGIRGNSRDR